MTDNKNVLRVLNGFLELSTFEKMEFSKEIESAISSGVIISVSSNETIKRRVSVKMAANLGPTNNNNCKCCGRG